MEYEELDLEKEAAVLRAEEATKKRKTRPKTIFEHGDNSETTKLISYYR